MRPVLLRLRALFRRGRVESELDEEMQFHLDQQTSENAARGMMPEEARYAALRAMGDVTQQKEACRDARRLNMIEHLGQDVRFAVRGLRRDTTLTLVAMLSLAICIGANTTIFSIVNTILLQPLPYPDSGQLYFVSEKMGRFSMGVVAAPDYYSMRDETKALEGLGAYDQSTVNWTGIDNPEQLELASVTPSFFRVMGAQPMRGRYLATGEEGPKAPAIVIVSYGFWRSRLGSDPHALGRAISLDRKPHVIVGVMPRGFDYPTGTQLWKPLDMEEGDQRTRLPAKPILLIATVARAKNGISEKAVRADMDKLSVSIGREYPKGAEKWWLKGGVKVSAEPLQRRMTGDVRPALLVLSVAVGLVLLIACANIANLLLARSTARQRELAVRMALGSSKARISRQLLTEAVVLAMPGGLIGAALAYVSVYALNAWQPLVLSRYPAIAVDGWTLAFTFGLTVATGLVFGMAPAFAAAGLGIQEALKAGSHTASAGRPAVAVRRVLVVGELAVCLVLMVGAGLLGRSFLELTAMPLGFPVERLLTLKVKLGGSKYASFAAQKQFHTEALERIRHLPMVRSASVVTDLPLSGDHAWSQMAFQIAGRPPVAVADKPVTDVSVIGEGAFQTLGIPLHRGRVFAAGDTAESTAVAVVNEAFVRQNFQNQDAIGREIASGANHRTRIVGVAGDVRSRGLGAEAKPLVYECECQQRSTLLPRMAFVIRTAGPPREAFAAVAAQIHSLDRDQPVFDVKTMEERLEDSLAPQRFQLILIGAFAGIAMVLAAAGVFGVLSYLVTGRTREIGIRIAMGARAGDVVNLVVGESFVLVIAAEVVGLAAAAGLTRYLRSMLYGVTALDGVTFAFTGIVLLGVALAGALAPARRAARVDPMVALRDE